MATFEIYRVRQGEYRWRLVNEDGVIAVGTEPFGSRRGAELQISVVATQALGARIVDLTGE